MIRTRLILIEIGTGAFTLCGFACIPSSTHKSIQTQSSQPSGEIKIGSMKSTSNPFHNDGERRKSSSSRLTRAEAINLLLTTWTFANSAIGDGGEVSDQVRAFQVILEQPDSSPLFRDVLARGRMAGQLYALCGLRIKDRAFFDVAVEKYRIHKGSVETQFGCIVLDKPVVDLIESKSPSALRLVPGQSPEDWRKRHANKYGESDIFGGGYSWEFSHAP